MIRLQKNGFELARLFRYFIAILFAVALAACGGGGGSAGSSGNGAALFVSAPSAITIIPGQTVQYTVGGGVPSYAVATATSGIIATIKDKVLTVTAVAGGTSQVTVTDSAGNKVGIAVTIGTGIPLFTSAPSEFSMAVGASTSSFVIGGGSAEYIVSVDNSSVVALSWINNSFSLFARAAGTANVTITDTMGGKISLKVTVTAGGTSSSASLTSTAPSTIKLALNETATYTISGGTPAYTVGSSDNSIVSASVSGNLLTVTGKGNGNASIKVLDTTGQNLPIAVQVGNATTAIFTSSPSDITVGAGNASPTFNVGGGTPPYTAVSANELVAKVALGTGSTFIVSGVAPGTTTVTLKDSTGSPVSINVTVKDTSTAPLALFTNAPSALTLQTSVTGFYLVSGGTPPYSAIPSNPSVVDSVVTGNNLSITGKVAGNAKVTISDSKGNKLPDIDVTVSGGTTLTLFTTAPSAITMATGSQPSYTISGGVAPYTVISSNAGVVSVVTPTVATSGGSFTLKGEADGSASVLITDSTGKTVPLIAVTVTNTLPGTLNTTAPQSGVTLKLGSTDTDNGNYGIIGGTPPFNVVSSDVTVAKITSPATFPTLTTIFSVKAVAAGTSTITVTDAKGIQASFAVKVLALTGPAFTVSPSNVTAGSLGDILYFRVDGGVPPYTILSNNSAAISIPSGTVLSSSGGTFTAQLTRASGTANQIVVSDATGAVQTVAISTVGAAATGFWVTPSSWTIDEATSAPVILTLNGGNGPYQIFWSNKTLANVYTSTGTDLSLPSSTFFNDNTLSIRVGTQGTRCVVGDTSVTFTIVDSLNRSTTSTMTIKNSNVLSGC